jgi:hypothetical protein
MMRFSGNKPLALRHRLDAIVFHVNGHDHKLLACPREHSSAESSGRLVVSIGLVSDF